MLEIRGLKLEIAGKPILKGVDLSLGAAASLGLVGESGSGKSMTALAMMGLLPPKAAVTGGTIEVQGRMSMVFQDPASCLNPVMRVGRQIEEAIELHGGDGTAERLMERVGIDGARAGQYPHQFSGGMRQRIMIAMALACRPALLIADEPTTALDVTVQAQVLKLIRSVCAESGIALLIISHDLGVIQAMAERVAVMRGGEVVEQGSKDEVLGGPRHPYTQSLLESWARWAGAA